MTFVLTSSVQLKDFRQIKTSTNNVDTVQHSLKDRQLHKIIRRQSHKDRRTTTTEKAHHVTITIARKRVYFVRACQAWQQPSSNTTTSSANSRSARWCVINSVV